MFVLDTDSMRTDLQRKGFEEKNIDDTIRRFSIFCGLEVKMYIDSTHGYIVGVREEIVIPRSWCRYERKEVNHDSNASTCRNR